MIRLTAAVVLALTLNPTLLLAQDTVLTVNVPSAEVHEHAIPQLHGDVWHFDFHASLGPNAHDRWFPYHIDTLGVGKRILAIIADLEKDKSLALQSPLAGEGGVGTGLLLVRRHDEAA